MMAKTPLLLALLVDYCNSSSGTLASSEFEVFESFIERKIAGALRRLGANQERASEAWRAAKMLARNLAHQSVPADGVPGAQPAMVVSAEGVSILREARLLKRSGAGESFAHKRFQEYFRVRSMLDGEERPPSLAPDKIDENRDVLNLFAQTCSNKRAKKLAEEVHDNLTEAFKDFQAAGAVLFGSVGP